jgi:hypothetical protein
VVISASRRRWIAGDRVYVRSITCSKGGPSTLARGPTATRSSRLPTTSNFCMRAAAACGPRTGGGDAPLRRRTDLAMRPLGAAVVGGGVDRRWRRKPVGGPRPRAAAVCGSEADVLAWLAVGPTARSSGLDDTVWELGYDFVTIDVMGVD